MTKTIQTRQLVFLSLCVCGGMIAKRVVTPVLNPLTDLIRLPGGGAAAAFSLLFIVLGCTVTDWPFAATLSALVQGALAFAGFLPGHDRLSGGVYPSDLHRPRRCDRYRPVVHAKRQ